MNLIGYHEWDLWCLSVPLSACQCSSLVCAFINL